MRFALDRFGFLTRWLGRRGARAQLEREAHRIEHFVTSNRIDVDTPEDLQRVSELLAARRSR